ncbi:MAG: ATP-binding protein [Synergistaceae bacterium]|nr:ATP-binding protein [Synergistaceae bacterium]
MNVELAFDREISADQESIFENERLQQRDFALRYLRAKFPEVDDKVFRTDYTGYVRDEVIEWPAVFKAAIIERSCTGCRNSRCEIPEYIGIIDSRPVISVSKSPKGFEFLDVRWTCGLACKFRPLSGEFGRLFRKSGLKDSHVGMTFKGYDCSKTTPETRIAKLEAMSASEEQSNLILAGKPGTGKTHLAVSIAIRTMEQGKQAMFRLVSTMLDEIQTAIAGKGDYDGLMRQFKIAPCLVLDDLGHENMTAARASYLHQIIDYRYNEKLQTIVTTNARNIPELGRLIGAEFVEPIVSRLLERGRWVTINNAEDFRTKKREVKNNGK